MGFECSRYLFRADYAELVSLPVYRVISHSIYLVHTLVLQEVGKYLHGTFDLAVVGLLLSLAYTSVL